MKTVNDFLGEIKVNKRTDYGSGYGYGSGAGTGSGYGYGYDNGSGGGYSACDG